VQGLAAVSDLFAPKFIAFDSSTLGRIARDYWSKEQVCREKARQFIRDLTEASVYVTVSMNHLDELLSHGNSKVVANRLAWLKTLPLIAWPRPYRGNWFVGGVFDLLLYELHSIVHDRITGWRAMFENIRPRILETAVGEEMFQDGPHWAMLKAHARRSSRNRQYIASVARVDVGDIKDAKLGDFAPLPHLPHRNAEEEKREAIAFSRRLEQRLVDHGDRRLLTDVAAREFTFRVLADLAQIKELSGNPYSAILDVHNVPISHVNPEMTVGELGELAVYVAHLHVLGKALRPAKHVTINDAPLDALPSHAVERAIRQEQHRAIRASGSDLIDGHVVALGFYIDAVEVDKRTYAHVEKVRNDRQDMSEHMRVFVRSDGEYPNLLETLHREGVI
jgi:hypothetical protein